MVLMNDDLYTGPGAESRIGRAVGEEPGGVGSGCFSNSPILFIMNHNHYPGQIHKNVRNIIQLYPVLVSVCHLYNMKSGHLKFCRLVSKIMVVRFLGSIPLLENATNQSVWPAICISMEHFSKPCCKF